MYDDSPTVFPPSHCDRALLHSGYAQTVCQAVTENCYRDCTYTVCRQVQETCYRDCSYTVSRPHCEVHCHTENYQVCKTVCETHCREQCRRSLTLLARFPRSAPAERRKKRYNR